MEWSQFLNHLQHLLLGFIGGVLICFSYFAVKDYHKFHEIVKSDYDTPWYSENWWIQPYTNYQVNKHDSEIVITEGADGAKWVVRSTMINGNEFWTRLWREDIEDDTN